MLLFKGVGTSDDVTEGAFNTYNFIIQWSGNVASHPDVIAWKDLVELGQSEDESRLADRQKRMAVNQCAMLVYTSGTTGMPKGSNSSQP